MSTKDQVPESPPANPEAKVNPTTTAELQIGTGFDFAAAKGVSSLPGEFTQWKLSPDGKFECDGNVCRPVDESRKPGKTGADPFVIPASFKKPTEGGKVADASGTVPKPPVEAAKPTDGKAADPPKVPAEPAKLPETVKDGTDKPAAGPTDVKKPGALPAPELPLVNDKPVTGDPTDGKKPGALPAPELDTPGGKPSDKGTEGTKPTDGKDTVKFIDGGKFETDAEGRVTKTTSADGTKVREFFRENSESPDEITKIRIDGNRLYEKAEDGSWTYTKDGQYVGQWRGTVNLEKNGLYNYHQEDQDQKHYFGSGREEIQPPPKDGTTDGGKPTNDTTGGDNTPAPSPDRGRGGLPLVPDVNPGPNPGPGPRPDSRPDTTVPPKPGDKPADNTDAAKRDREVEEAKKALKERYGTSETEKALRHAALTGRKLVVHLGMHPCGPCSSQEANVWNNTGFQKELRDNNISLLKLDKDEVRGNLGGDLAKQLNSYNQGYPTILEVVPKINSQGKVEFQVTNQASGYLRPEGTRSLLHMPEPQAQPRYRQNNGPRYYR